MLRKYSDAELMLAPDGSIYHLRMHPEQLHDVVLLVGDPARIDLVAEHLSRVESLANNREFRSIVGYCGSQPINVVSTGIGAGCIDIVINELDSLANIDLTMRTTKERLRSLHLLRIGTSGALQPDIETGRTLITAISLAFDNLANFYAPFNEVTDNECKACFVQHAQYDTFPQFPMPYCVSSAVDLVQRFSGLGEVGLTFSMPGFYAPQGRALRLEPYRTHFIETAQNFSYKGLRAVNMEMESGALNGLAAMLGHKSITFCTAINNRSQGNANPNYAKAMHELVESVFSKLTRA